MFRQLTKSEVKCIADIMLKDVFRRAEEKGIKIDVTGEGERWLLARHMDGGRGQKGSSRRALGAGGPRGERGNWAVRAVLGKRERVSGWGRGARDPRVSQAWVVWLAAGWPCAVTAQHLLSHPPASPSRLGPPAERFKDRLVEEGYNPAYGARPLRRAIMRLLEDSMAERMLAGDIKEGDSVILDGEPAAVGLGLGLGPLAPACC